MMSILEQLEKVEKLAQDLNNIVTKIKQKYQQMYNAAKKMSETSETMVQKIQKQIENAKATQTVK